MIKLQALKFNLWITVLALILNLGCMLFISCTPPFNFWNALGILRIRSCTSSFPYRDTMILSIKLTICSTFLSIDKPVDNRLILIFCLRRISQNLKKFGFNKASPPDITTSRVPNFFNEESSPITSFSVSCLRFLLSFQMSHITHWQLHAL